MSAGPAKRACARALFFALAILLGVDLSSGQAAKELHALGFGSRAKDTPRATAQVQTPAVSDDERLRQLQREDLSAQKEMAHAATRMVDLTAFQLGLGLITVLGVGATLYFTRLTAVAAVDAARAAEDSAGVARDTFAISKLAMSASDRAYVHYAGVRWISHRELGTDRLFWRIRPSWTNSGNTPTRQLRVFVAYELRDNPLPEDFSFSGEQVHGMPTISLAPHGTIESGWFTLWADDLLAVQDGRKHFYAWGIARYRDIFPDTPEHMTRMCVYAANVMGDPTSEWDKETNQVEINFRHHRTNNCADEDCG